MIYDVQKAGVLKRISAFLLDLIVLSVLATGFSFLFSLIFNVESQNAKLQEYYDYYTETYNVKFGLTQEDFQNLSEEELNHYYEVEEIIKQDKAFNDQKNKYIILTLVVIFLGILVGFAISEFLIPLLFKNGQTVGKKVFSLGVLKTNAVRISGIQFFIRTFFGKFIVETIVPINIIVMILLGISIPGGGLIIIGLLLVQIVMFIVTKNRQVFHDLLAFTVVCDMSSQMIFDSDQALLEYKEKIHEESVQKSVY